MPAHKPWPSKWPLARATYSVPLIAGLAGVYFIACRLGLHLAVIHPSATAIWPGTGIALAAMLLLGYRVWPGIFLGALVVNLTTAGSILTGLGIATGNTLEGLLGAYLVTRFANGSKVFERAEDIFKFLFLACVLATNISASMGAASLVLTGYSPGMQPEAIWLTWWLGDMTGAMIVTPCFLLWSSPQETHRNLRQVLRQGVALASLLLVGAIVFGDFLFRNSPGQPLKFTCIPFVVWAAFELRPRAAALAMLAFSGVAMASMLRAARGAPIANESLLVLQVFLGVAALTGLLVSVAVSERNRHEQSLAAAKSELEERVRERTREVGAGLRWYIDGFKERSKIEVSLNMDENLRFPADLEMMVFRVVQECLTNIHRHSGSATAAISLSNSGQKLTLQIRDQGKGIAPDKLAGGAGVGLRGMRERVKRFGGEFEILSEASGTLVRATIPVGRSGQIADG